MRTRSDVSRRDFLAKVIALGGGAAALPVLAQAPSSMVASVERSRAQRSPTFVAGTLVSVSATRIEVQETDPQALTLLKLTTQTVIYRLGIALSWNALQLGDNITANTRVGADGSREALWVQANAVASWGEVESVSSDGITLAPYGRMGRVARELVLAPYTKMSISLPTDGAAPTPLAAGDHIYFTGAADQPNPYARRVWAYNVFRVGR